MKKGNIEGYKFQGNIFNTNSFGSEWLRVIVFGDLPFLIFRERKTIFAALYIIPGVIKYINIPGKREGCRRRRTNKFAELIIDKMTGALKSLKLFLFIKYKKK